jgi:Streptomycin adenylyltransferase/Transaldolase/Fructose-6-phosphate aldolase
MTRLQQLFAEQGQSPWLDDLKRGHLRSGELGRLIGAGIRGVIANPTIFEHAIAGSEDYDEQFASLTRRHVGVEDAYWDLVIDDIVHVLHLRPAAVAGARWMAEDPEGVAVLRRGFRVLVDKLGLERTLGNRVLPPPAPGRPDQAAFAQLTHDFWYHLLWAAKKLRRGELWIAAQTCNCHLKGLLVTLLAWHTTRPSPWPTPGTAAASWSAGPILRRCASFAMPRLGTASSYQVTPSVRSRARP